MKKDLQQIQEDIDQQAMKILEPIYNRKVLDSSIDKETGEVFLAYRKEMDVIRKEIISAMVQSATDDFIKNKGLYSSSLFHVCTDFDAGIESGIVPSLAKDEDVVKFYEANKKDIITRAERLCSFYGADFENIPGFDYTDRHMKSSTNKIAVTRYVVNEEINEISMELHKFRNYLEDIKVPRFIDKQMKGSLKVRNVKNHIKEKDNSLDM